MLAAFIAFLLAIWAPLLTLLQNLGVDTGGLPDSPVAVEWVGPTVDEPADAFAFLPGVTERGPPKRLAA